MSPLFIFTPDAPGHDLAAALYAGFVHDTWALRHWKTKHNCHVEFWHGVSAPGRAA